MLKHCQINSENLQNLTSIIVTFILIHNTRMSFKLEITSVSFVNIKLQRSQKLQAYRLFIPGKKYIKPYPANMENMVSS